MQGRMDANNVAGLVDAALLPSAPASMGNTSGHSSDANSSAKEEAEKEAARIMPPPPSPSTVPSPGAAATQAANGTPYISPAHYRPPISATNSSGRLSLASQNSFPSSTATSPFEPSSQSMSQDLSASGTFFSPQFDDMSFGLSSNATQDERDAEYALFDAFLYPDPSGGGESHLAAQGLGGSRTPGVTAGNAFSG
jgi:hypothetical protein